MQDGAPRGDRMRRSVEGQRAGLALSRRFSPRRESGIEAVVVYRSCGEMRGDDVGVRFSDVRESVHVGPSISSCRLVALRQSKTLELDWPHIPFRMFIQIVAVLCTGGLPIYLNIPDAQFRVFT